MATTPATIHPELHDAIEAAYWEFDARRSGYSRWKTAPQSERDAFKAVVVGLLTRQAANEGNFLLASFHHGTCDGSILWWRPDSKGYTPDLEQAGEYTAAQVAAKDVGLDDAVAVPLAMLKTLRIRRTVDPGDHLNGAFRSHETLRKHVADFKAVQL